MLNLETHESFCHFNICTVLGKQFYRNLPHQETLKKINSIQTSAAFLSIPNFPDLARVIFIMCLAPPSGSLQDVSPKTGEMSYHCFLKCLLFPFCHGKVIICGIWTSMITHVYSELKEIYSLPPKIFLQWVRWAAGEKKMYGGELHIIATHS